MPAEFLANHLLPTRARPGLMGRVRQTAVTRPFGATSEFSDNLSWSSQDQPRQRRDKENISWEFPKG